MIVDGKPRDGIRALTSSDESLSKLHSPRTFLFAGGGSGGHLFPGVAVAEELLSRDPTCRIVFVGSERGIEARILDDGGWRRVVLPILPPSVSKRRPIRFLSGIYRSHLSAGTLMEEFRPTAVIGLGGFASLPLGVAALSRGIPLILLEQNVVPGRATSLLSRWADRICVSFEGTAELLPRRVKVQVTGNPVRRLIQRNADFSTPSATRRPTLLILGGSQGAAGVNAMVVAAVKTLRARLTGWKIAHQTGERDHATVREAYAGARIDADVAPFFEDLPSRYPQATLVISRAGATTLAELACVACPAILIPYPGSVRDHQRRNAKQFAAEGAADIIPEGMDAPARLGSSLSALLDQPARLRTMAAAMRRLAKPNAAEEIADLLVPRKPAAAAA